MLLDAFATWCGPCKAVAPVVAKYVHLLLHPDRLRLTYIRWAESEEYKDKIYFAKFDVDHLPDLAAELGVRAMPTFYLFKNGDKVDEHLGGNPGPIQALMQKSLAA